MFSSTSWSCSCTRELLLAAALIGLSAARVQADDWLAVWPECSAPEASRAELSLLYPSLGLPAVVQAGQTLVARVRMPAALTPPPGVQQERALTNFLGMLSAPAPRVGVPGAAHHRHTLPVVAVRADGASSLVYRVRLQLPEYLADGTYTFTLRTPFGTREAVGSVRVVRAAPRIARLPHGMSLPPTAAGSWPVDVWLADEEPEAASALPVEVSDERSPPLRLAAAAAALLNAQLAPLAAAPVLPYAGPALALRVGGELWVRQGCADSRAFEREVSSLVANEGLRRIDLRLAVERSAPPPSAAELASGPELALGTDSAQFDNQRSARDRELSLLLPFANAVRVSAGVLELFPARDPSAEAPLTKLARWRVPAGVRASLNVAPAQSAQQLALTPLAARSGQPARLQVRGAEARSRVAYALGFARSAYGSSELRTSFAGPLATPVRAQVFASDGVGQVASGAVWVEPYRPPNCTAGRPGQPCGLGLWAVTVLAVLVRRRRLAKKAALPARLE